MPTSLQYFRGEVEVRADNERRRTGRRLKEEIDEDEGFGENDA